MTMNKILITGVAGFNGSNLLENLISNNKDIIIIGIDNLSTGKLPFINKFKQNKRFKFIKEDLANLSKIKKFFKGVDTVFHFAALADVRKSHNERKKHYINNILVTQNIIEAITYKIKHIIFTSTGSVW